MTKSSSTCDVAGRAPTKETQKHSEEGLREHEVSPEFSGALISPITEPKTNTHLPDDALLQGNATWEALPHPGSSGIYAPRQKVPSYGGSPLRGPTIETNLIDSAKKAARQAITERTTKRVDELRSIAAEKKKTTSTTAPTSPRIQRARNTLRRAIKRRTTRRAKELRAISAEKKSTKYFRQGLQQ